MPSLKITEAATNDGMKFFNGTKCKVLCDKQQRFREFNLCKQRLFYMRSSRLCVELKVVCYLVSTKTIRLRALVFYERNSQRGAYLLRELKLFVWLLLDSSRSIVSFAPLRFHLLKRNVKSPLKVKAGIVVKISSILTDKTDLKNRTEGIGTIGKRDMDGNMTDLTSNSNHKHLTDIKTPVNKPWELLEYLS